VIQPKPPRGIVAHYLDGTSEPIVEVVYVGVEDGTHVWACAISQPLDHLAVAVFPAKTMLRIELPHDSRLAWFQP
jgi:hypothetical protein